LTKVQLDSSWYELYDALDKRGQVLLSCHFSPLSFDDVPHIRIKAFETIVQECKEGVEYIDEEQVRDVIKVLTATDVTDSRTCFDSLNTYFDKFLNPTGECMIDKQLLNTPYDCVKNNRIAGERYLCAIEQIIKEIVALQDELTFYAKKISHQKFLYFFKYDITEATLLDQQCEKLKNQLKKHLEATSEQITHTIKTNFYAIYTSLNYLLHYITLKNDLILGIDIAHIIDRILRVIKPSFYGHAMQNKYLIYYHLEYEFKELYQNLVETLNTQQ
jgi:hypothetical protein